MAATAEKLLPEDTVASLFGPAVVLPSQFTEQMGAKQSDRGEKVVAAGVALAIGALVFSRSDDRIATEV